MARSLVIFSLPILLSLLLADATRNNLLPFSIQENNEDDSVIIQDAFEQSSLLRLPSESESKKMEVPELVRTPLKRVRGPPETHNRFSAFPGLRGESDSIFRPTEGEGDSISPLKRGESDSIFLGRGGEGEEGRKGSRFGRPGAGCHHQHHHGDETKFGHYVFTSPEDASSFRNFPREFFPRDEKEFPLRAEKEEEHKHGKHQRPSESEVSEFEPRERAFERNGRGFPQRGHAEFERIGKDFPEREHTQFEHIGKGFPERKHTQFEPPGEGFPEREHTQFEPPGEGFPEREHTHSHGQWERESRNGNDFPDREHTQFEHTGKGFPEREHTHSHSQGQWKWESRNEEGQKHGRHERQEDLAAPWTDWLRSLLSRH